MLSELLDTTNYIETLLVVKTKERKTAPFKLTPIQNRIVREQQLRNIYVKPRQIGVSTLILGQNFARTVTEENFTAVTAAHDAETTEYLFDTIHYFYNNLPPIFQPKTKYSNRRELFFPVLNSRYIVFTAGGKNGPGRGTTVNAMHGTEVSRWPNPDEILSGLMESAPKDARVDLESTANGAGDFFNTTYDEAKAGINGYKAFFFPWWEQLEYRLTIQEALDRNVDITAPYDDEETALVDKYGLSVNQIYWRRWKKATLKRQFQQEYPEDDATCFLTSGNLYFDLDVLQNAKRVGEAKPVEISDNGRFKVWERPQPGKSYMVGADVAEGVANGDYSAAYVIDMTTGRDVATLHGHWDTHGYAVKLAEIGNQYNTALLAVERNNHGHAVLSALTYELSYPNIYQHRDYDVKGNATSKPGFPTNMKTKPIMLSTLGRLLEDAPEFFRDNEFFTECFRFVQHDNGKAGAIQGAHDDRVIARAIAGEVWAHGRSRTFGDLDPEIQEALFSLPGY
jgi:hypothetical protein